MDRLAMKSARVLSLGERYHESAMKSLRECKSSSERLNASHTKLDIVGKQLRAQVHVVRQLEAKVVSRSAHLQAHANQLVEQETHLLSLLDRVFDQLKAVKLDAALVSASEQSKEAAEEENEQENERARKREKGDAATLFDFVDLESVSELKANAFNHVESLRRLCAIAGRLEAGSRQVCAERASDALVDELLRPIDYRIDESATPIARQQMTDLAEIRRQLTSIASLHDRVEHLASETSVDASKVASFGDFERSVVEKLRAAVTVINERTQSIRQSAADVDERALRYRRAFEMAAKLYGALEQCALPLKNALLELEALAARFDEIQIRGRFIFEELTNLVAWYEKFQLAYAEMLVEVERRHRFHRAQQRVVDAYAAELDRLARDEHDARRHFHIEHGRFLPPDMCPAIHEPPTLCRVLPARIQSNLPLVCLSGSGGEQHDGDES
jgi:Autophagy protein ATG17-like domain